LEDQLDHIGTAALNKTGLSNECTEEYMSCQLQKSKNFLENTNLSEATQHNRKGYHRSKDEKLSISTSRTKFNLHPRKQKARGRPSSFRIVRNGGSNTLFGMKNFQKLTAKMSRTREC